MLFFLIIILPLLNTLILGFFGNKIGTLGTKLCTISFMGLALLLVLNFFILTIKGYFFYINLGTWFSLDFFIVR